MTDKKIHIIDNETGYCTTCKKYEDRGTLEKNYLKYTDVGITDIFSTPALSIKSAKISPILTSDSSIKPVKFRRHTNCDICCGKLSDKLDIFRFCESLYFIPLWLLILLSIIYGAVIGAAVYQTVSYVSLISLKMYGDSCTSTTECNTARGLYCRSKNLTDGSDFCNCPTLSLANMCDCYNSYYWNGSACTAVHKYGSGPCAGDYSCEQGSICSPLTGNCSCPDATPIWDPSSKSCNYYYKGCFSNCYGATCDYTANDCYLTNNPYSPPRYEIDLDICVNYCSIINAKYAHMSMYNNAGNYIYRCCCSSTYNKSSVVQADSNCNVQCFVTPGTLNIYRCPKINYQSSFQIGL